MRQIKYVSAGENHCGAIDANGNAYTWGLNANGQCGVSASRAAKGGAVVLVTPPAPITLSTLMEKTGANFTGSSMPMEPRKVKAIMIECGGAHSLFLS
mmetsp:Transcript_3960/g.5260  ORF Transcript_3960/g.5260 Transcript_3960/m.5260 type:complete len:98 (+) Transcript_3960:275-568(+)